ncbi:hypothetical protein GYB22_12085 [bacterium]|nr:hypothetical protein [bacterium]
MQKLKKFYSESYMLWVIFKIILGLILLISTISTLQLSRLSATESSVNTIGLIIAILSLITLKADFSSSTKFPVLKMMSGIGLLAIGLAIFVVLLTISEGGRSDFYFLEYPFSLLIILTGLFDVLNVDRADTVYM